jgi:hypothetical protein
MKWLVVLLVLTVVLAGASLQGRADMGPVFRVDFANPGLTPSKWSIEMHPDGTAHFHSEPGEKTAAQLHAIEPGALDRDIRLSREFAERAFETAHRHRFFNEACESHLKVAFQGSKTFSYAGADGTGSCEFNYSKSKDIQALGDSLVAVASTVVEGARLELLLQHDPLGLDQEMRFMKEASVDGRLQQMGAIQPILTKLAEDEDVMERVRRDARQLLQDGAK